MIMYSTDVAFARRSTCLFSSLEIWTTWSETRPFVSLLAPGISSLFPLCIRSHHSPGLWPPENRSIQPHLWPLMALARSSPTTRISYSASLLVTGKSRRTIHLILFPSGEQSIILAPPAYLLDNPPVWILHWGCSPAPWPSMLVISAMKSATTCAFMAVRGRYYTLIHSTLLLIVPSVQPLHYYSLLAIGVYLLERP